MVVGVVISNCCMEQVIKQLINYLYNDLCISSFGIITIPVIWSEIYFI